MQATNELTSFSGINFWNPDCMSDLHKIMGKLKDVTLLGLLHVTISETYIL